MQDPQALQVLVTVLTAVLVLSRLARYLRIPSPVVLLLGGVPLAFLPWTAEVTLPPEVVLLLFLPALLYWESLTTSLREIRSNLRVVLLSSVVPVLVTAATVAVVGHAVGLSWPVAWVLGAVVAPTDATAVAAVARGMPRRTLTILRAESLVNDGTALVVFAIAVAAATGAEQFTWLGAGGRFLLSYAGGAAAGLAGRARRIMRDPLLENTVGVLTPFAAYLLAEDLHASGVLAVVVCGLALSQAGPRTVSARTRLQARAFWQVTTFLLNGTLFVLVGMQLRGALAGLHDHGLAEAVRDAALVALTVIGTRLLWSYTTPYLIRMLDRRPAQRLRRVGARQRLAIAWSGFRGGVSLAAALAVPLVLVDGTPFPGRDLVVVVTFGVILVTLLVQAPTLPAVLRFSRLPEDESEAREEALAHRSAAEAGLAALPAAATRLGVTPAVADHVRADYEERQHALADPGEPGTDPGPARSEQADHRRLRRALLAEKRAAVVALRDAGRIDDIVLRRVQAGLGAEEVRLARVPDGD